jgi:hemerythrin
MPEHAILAEHRRLDALFAETRAALEPCDAEVARRALEDLLAALAVHFEQEDALYYPVVASLRPDHAARVRDFAAAHARFRAELAEVGRESHEGSRARAREAFEAFARAFASHEAAEEELLRSVDAGGHPSR